MYKITDINKLRRQSKEMAKQCKCNCKGCTEAKGAKVPPVDKDAPKHIKGLAKGLGMNENDLISADCKATNEIINKHCKGKDCRPPPPPPPPPGDEGSGQPDYHPHGDDDTFGPK